MSCQFHGRGKKIHVCFFFLKGQRRKEETKVCNLLYTLRSIQGCYNRGDQLIIFRKKLHSNIISF